MTNRPLGAMILITLPFSCSDSRDGPEPAGTGRPAAAIAGLPATMSVRQRSTTEIPGSEGRLLVSVDDVTRGQVQVAVVSDRAGTGAGPWSMRAGERRMFRFEGARYVIELLALDNALVGQDFAMFRITGPEPDGLAEPERIERLIAAVEGLAGAVFIRNGTRHGPTEAAAHLRRKLAAAGDDAATAELFIERVASKSSLSGEEYALELPDGRRVALRQWLGDALARIDAGPAR